MSGRTLEKLIYMANQIAREFAGQRPRDAAEATWDHLWHVWDPRMRAMIVAHLAAGGEGLSDVAKDADDRIIYNGVTGKLYYDADGNGPGVQVLFAQLVAGAEDFPGHEFAVARADGHRGEE